MPNNVLLQIQPLAVDPLTVQTSAAPEAPVREGAGMLCGIDVGSTTCKYVLASASGEVLAQAYERHNTKQGEKVLDFLSCLESEHGLTPERDRIFFTGSGAGIIAPLVGGKIIQEVVAVAAAVEKLHPLVRFVSEIGGEDMKTMFFTGLQEAWRHHLTKLWQERKVALPGDKDAASLIRVPDDALYYAAQGCIEVARREPQSTGLYQGAGKLRWWIEEGQHEEKKKLGRGGLWKDQQELASFKARYGGNGTSPGNGKSNGNGRHPSPATANAEQLGTLGPVAVGCDFGSTTAKAVCLSPQKDLLFSCYALSKGNPIEDAKALFRQIRAAVGNGTILGLAITGYGKDLLKDILGADCPVVETIAHASAGLQFFPDADCICDVGGVDVKIMILNNGAVTDFRLNSQCSSGNGAFLQGVAERFNIPMNEMAEGAFRAQAMPQLSMGGGVFLQSDIVNQQRKGWQADEILAGLSAILPLNVWSYAEGTNNTQAVGKKYMLQGGTHKNLAVVKTQVDFILSKIPEAEVVVHPYSGEAGAIGAALVALEWAEKGGQTAFRGFDAIEKLSYRTATSVDTVCHWCPVNCQRSFIDVELVGVKGREWSKVPLAKGWERVIVNNSCPKGLVEDLNEMKVIKAGIEKTKNAYPNIADMVRKEAFRRTAS